MRHITGRDDRGQNAKPSRTVGYRTAQGSTRILELENRCTGNRTVGSNPTLSASYRLPAAHVGVVIPLQTRFLAVRAG